MAPFSPTPQMLQSYLKITPDLAVRLSSLVTQREHEPDESMRHAATLLHGAVRRLFGGNHEVIGYFIARPVRRPMRAYTLIYDPASGRIVLETPRYFKRHRLARRAA